MIISTIIIMIVRVFFNLHCIHDLMKNDTISNVTNLFNSTVIIKELYLRRKKIDEQVDRQTDEQVDKGTYRQTDIEQSTLD